MEKYYLKNPQTNKIVEFASKDCVGRGYKDWVELQADEIQSYILSQAKETKIQEINKFYNSQELWLFTIEDTLGNKLTKSQEWFLMRITTNITLIDDNGHFVQKTIEDPEALKTKLNNKGLELFQKKEELLQKVKACQSIAEVESVNVQQAFGTISKVIDI